MGLGDVPKIAPDVVFVATDRDDLYFAGIAQGDQDGLSAHPFRDLTAIHEGFLFCGETLIDSRVFLAPLLHA